MRQSSNCSIIQILNENEISTVISVNATSTKFASINCIAFSSQIFYLIIENLYHKQKILLTKIEENLAVIEAEKAAIVVQKAIEEANAARKQNSKIKSRNFSESFKSEKFTINFNSTSTILNFESIIKSDIVFVVNSIFISISENSKLNSSRSISFCSTSTILLISQSNRSLVVNIMFFVNYDKRLTTFKKWFYTNSTFKTLIQAEFRYTSTKLSLNCIICRRYDLIFENWKLHDDFIKEHFQRNFECFKTKTIVDVFKSQSKIKLNKFFKSFKFEEFAINFNSNSTSMILCFESIIKSNVVFVANSIFISISENSNSTFLRSILFCSTSTILLINQSSYLLVANQLVVEKVVKQVIIETIKSEIIDFKNINFFDFTMQVNLWEKFHISINSASFLYHLIEFVVKYKKKNLLKLFFQCLRDSALLWRTCIE